MTAGAGLIPERSLFLVAQHEAVRQRLHEADERILLRVGQTKSPQLCCVQVVGRLWLRPAGRPLAGIVAVAARQYVARVVEMNDHLQAGEVSVVSVGLHKAGIRSFVDVAQRRNLKEPLICRRELDPVSIRDRGLAQRMTFATSTNDLIPAL